MKRLASVFIFCVAVIFASHVFAESVVLTSQQEERLSTLSEILLVIYDNDASLIPNEPNEITALQTSSESRDLLVWEIFRLMRDALDPNYIPEIEEESLTISASKQAMSVETSEEESDESTSIYSRLAIPEMMTMSSMQSSTLTGSLDSCVLESGTYNLTSLPLQIEGHVVIPAGTKFIAPYDPNHAIIEVLPGGRLDIGSAVFYDANDYPSVLPPVEIIPQDPNIYSNHNQVGIKIDYGADSKTRIENVIVMNCAVGIMVGEELDNAIQNVVTYGCYDGIHLYAPAGIRNCEFWQNGTVYIGPFGYVSAGIFFYPDISRYPNPVLEIQQTITYGADVGLYYDTVVSDANVVNSEQMVVDMTVVNSCFTANYFYGIYQANQEANVEIMHCALGGNQNNSNLSGSCFTGIVYLYDSPFYNRQEDWARLYISPLSPLIDAGYGYASDGMGVCHDQADIGIMDIGCHFPLGTGGSFGIQSSPADFNWDGIVDEDDLAILNACMGATDDPNLVRMDFNYDSWINLPDFAQLAADYGYCGDPNVCSNTDPNCLRSDFDGDNQVDLADLAVLSEEWLSPVFDEYRFCSLCNLHTGVDPNDPNGLSGSHIIDQRDVNVLMDDWLEGFSMTFSASFYDENDSIIDPNELSGTVTLLIDEYPDSTMGFFWQLDGTSNIQTYPDNSAPPVIKIPTYRFSNSNHMLTIGGYLYEGGCWLEQIPVSFENHLYLTSIPEMYEPNELYEVSGFFDDGTVEVYTEPNVSTTFNDGYVDYTTTISNTDGVELTINYEGGEASATQSYALTKAINMENEDPNSYEALIIAPFDDINEDFEVTFEAIRTALAVEGIDYMELIEKNASWDNISIALRGSNLHYVYWISHTNSQIGETRNLFNRKVTEDGIHRTNFKCWDKRRFWPDSEGKIFSCMQSDGITNPPTLDSLPNGWESKGHSMWSLRLWETKTIKEFWAIGCETGLDWENAGDTYNYNDMAYAVGAYYTDSQGNHVHVYMGNSEPVWFSGGLLGDALVYPDAIAHIIQRHVNHDLEDALVYGPQDSNERKAVWGIDGDRDGLTDNVLQWYPKDTKLDGIHFY